MSGGGRERCDRCGRPKARDIQDAVSLHFGRGFCCDVEGSPAGQLECRERALERALEIQSRAETSAAGYSRRVTALESENAGLRARVGELRSWLTMRIKTHELAAETARFKGRHDIWSEQLKSTEAFGQVLAKLDAALATPPPTNDTETG